MGVSDARCAALGNSSSNHQPQKIGGVPLRPASGRRGQPDIVHMLLQALVYSKADNGLRDPSIGSREASVEATDAFCLVDVPRALQCIHLLGTSDSKRRARKRNQN